MSNGKINVSIREPDQTIPSVHWEKVFYFGGGDGHWVIYGHHAAGGFFAIPNLNIACEASEYAYSREWNYGSLIGAGVRKEYAAAIADYVEEYNRNHAAEIDVIHAEDKERQKARLAARGFTLIE